MAGRGERSWDIGNWLRGLGLEQYEAGFRQNEVNESVLPKLTQEDLGKSVLARLVIAG
jgi:SAM (Sterile alpha motif) domain-containing protein